MSNTLKIPSKHLVGLCSWLNELSLTGKESRERSRFVDICVPRIQEYFKHKEEIFDRYCVKETVEGREVRKVVDEGGVLTYQIPNEKREEFDKEIHDLEDEEFVIDVLEGNKSKIKTAKDLLLNTDYKFGPGDETDPAKREAKIRQTTDYNEWCKIFEEVNVD